MTTRNFRVNNGLEVGDIVISASANTITGGTTAAPSADGQFANKKYVDDGLAGLSQNAISQNNTNITVTDSGTGKIEITADGTEVADFAVAATTMTATGAINLTAGSDVVIPANVGLTFGTGEKIEGDSTDLTVTSGGALNLTATTDIVVPANVGITFGTGEKIEGDSTNLTVTSGGAINLTAVTDVVVPANVGVTFGTGEKIEGDNTDLTVTSGAKINLTAVSDVHIPKNVGIVFDDNASEKIESNDTDLTINSGAKINLTATSDIHVPANVGVVFGTGEKIEGDSTDLTITSGGAINLTAVTDIVVPANVGITYGTGEKIEGDNTDLTVTSGGAINLTAVTDVVVPANVGVTFGTGEKIEGNNTDLTITSGADITLAAAADVNIPVNIGLRLGDGGENIETDNTDLTITSGGKINLATASDVHMANDKGIVFGDGGEKIEGDGTNLTIASSGILNLTATGNTAITNNATIGGNLVLTGNLTVNGTTETIATTNTTIADNLIELQSGISASTNDSGLIIERGSTGNNAAIIWDESADKFAMGLTTSTGADKSGGITVSTGTLLANLEGAVTGDLTGTADIATAITAADESSDTACNVLFVTAATGDLPPKTGTNLTFNSNSGVLTATGFAGALTGDVTGTADVATAITATANNTGNEDIFICLVDGASGTQGIETDTGLKYNPSTNVIASTASSAQYADVAERFEADALMETGSVVMVGGSAEITEITSEMSEDVFGVISHKPAYMMNAGAGSDESHPYVAMTGRTPVRVIGEVTKGQRLDTSSTKGCARGVAQGESFSPFNVIGRALETDTDTNIKLVNCAVRSNN